MSARSTVSGLFGFRRLDMDDKRTVAGPNAWLLDRPDHPGEVDAIRKAIDRAQIADPGATVDMLVRAVQSDLDRAGRRRPPAERLRALVARLM